MYCFLNKIAIIILFLSACCRSGVLVAQTSDSALAGMTVGIEGVYKNGFSTPITIKTTLDAGTVELSSFDSDGSPVAISAPLAGTSQTLYFPLGRANGSLGVRLYDNQNKVVLERQFEPRSVWPKDPEEKLAPFFYGKPKTSQPLILVVGDEKIGLREALSELRIREDRRPIIERIRRFESLPDQWIGYESVETLILTTTDPKFFEGIKYDDVRIKAISRWVQSGGRLVIFAGKDSLPLITDNGALSRLVPGTFDSKLREIRIANSITQYVPKAKNLVMTGSLDAPYLNVPFMTKPYADAVVELAEMETPILVRRSYGLGTTTFFAADLAEVPISSWTGRSGLLIKMFGMDTDKTHQVSGEGMLVQLGFSDLSGQLRSALDRFEGVRNVPFSIILILAFVYLLLIGPGDWYLTHRLLKKPNLTWITFPIYIVLFCVFVVWLGIHSKPTDVKLNRVDLIDVDQVSGTIRGTTWAGIYSPRDARYDFALSLPPMKPFAASSDQGIPKLDFVQPQMSLSWLGLQGTGLGAMSPKTITIPFWREPYRQGTPSSQLDGVPIQVHATKSLMARWLYQSEVSGKSQLKDFDSVPIGTVVNPYPVPLQNAVLFYNRWALNLGTLAPGETKLDIKTPKTERHLVIGTTENAFSDIAGGIAHRGLTRYNTESTNIPYILRAMTFFRLIGGYEALGLDNSLQHYVDLSEQLQFGRAILTATVQDDLIAAPDNHTVFPLESKLSVKDCKVSSGHRSVVLRMILPVEKYNHD